MAVRRAQRRVTAVVALTLLAAPVLTGCSVFTGEGDFLKDLDGAIRTGQQWWQAGSKQIQEFGSGMQQFFSAIDLGAMGEQLSALCATVNASDTDGATGTQADDPAFVEKAIRAMVRTATGKDATEEQLRGVLGLLGEHCTN